MLVNLRRGHQYAVYNEVMPANIQETSKKSFDIFTTLIEVLVAHGAFWGHKWRSYRKIGVKWVCTVTN